MIAYRNQVRAAVPFVAMVLSPQHEQVLAYVLGGISLPAAMKAAGLTKDTVKDLLENENFAAYLDYFSERHVEEINFTRQDAHAMLLETHRKSISSTEELMVLKEIIALHGIAAPKVQVNKNHNVNENIQRSDFSQISDADLMNMSGGNIKDLDPEAVEVVQDD